MKLNIYHIDDGEDWWIVATSPDEALKLARQFDVDEEHELSSSDVGYLENNEYPFPVFLPDYHPLDHRDYPTKPTQDKKGRWFCSALVSEWLADAKPGDLIASSIY